MVKTLDSLNSDEFTKVNDLNQIIADLQLENKDLKETIEKLKTQNQLIDEIL